MGDNFDRYVFVELPEPIAELLKVFAESRGWTLSYLCADLISGAVRDAFFPKEAS